jgi:hypothetical protein
VSVAVKFRKSFSFPVVVLGVLVAAWAMAAPAGEQGGAPVAAVKYRSGKEIRFDELLIQGQMKRPEVSVVTGDQAEFSNGLLRLRENFLDHAANDLGQEVQQ